MSIYQAPRKRWRIALAAGIVGLLAGLGIGYALGRNAEPDTAHVIRTLDAQLSEAAASLDVLVIHGEAGTAAADDAQVARDALRRVRTRFEKVRPAVHALDPRVEAEIDRHIDVLNELIERRAGTKKIAAEAETLASLLRNVVGT